MKSTWRTKHARWCKKPKPINPQPKRKCVYDVATALTYDARKKPCGKVTGNKGQNRFYCLAHHSLVSMMENDIP